MIISHKHRYVFVELPNTASSAIHATLCENYDGISILHKHAYYHEFLRIANTEERNYFVFSCIRNPLDVVVTNYFKHKTDHKGIFTNPKTWKKNGGWVTEHSLRKYSFIKDTNADFPAYFKKFHRFPPYDNWSNLSHRKFDLIIRFESLQEDFAKVLELLGIESKSPLPVVNKTAERGKDFWSYYTPEIRDQARRVFGPFMKKWGYNFPPEWGDCSVPWSSQVLFHISSFLRRRLEWGSSFDAQLFRRFVGL